MSEMYLVKTPGSGSTHFDGRALDDQRPLIYDLLLDLGCGNLYRLWGGFMYAPEETTCDGEQIRIECRDLTAWETTAPKCRMIPIVTDVGGDQQSERAHVFYNRLGHAVAIGIVLDSCGDQEWEKFTLL